MHELGHALGLGHALPLKESTDLMGYGWHWSNGIVPTLSECDLAGIAFVFAWALEALTPILRRSRRSPATEDLP